MHCETHVHHMGLRTLQGLRTLHFDCSLSNNYSQGEHLMTAVEGCYVPNGLYVLAWAQHTGAFEY